MRRPAIVPVALTCAVLLAACSRPVDPVDDATPPGEVVESPTPTTPSPSPTTGPSPSPTASPTAGLDDLQLAFEEVVRGLGPAVFLTFPPDDPRRFVVEQAGRIVLLQDGELSTYLDIADRVTVGGERGLLGLAFHPEFASNGRLFLHYSGPGGDTVLAEYRADPDGDTADPASERVLLTVEQPAANHNGGRLTFGPDGLLYLGLGDGGGAGDQFGNGQDPTTLLGTILRIDVDEGDPYAIPPGNPFADGDGGAPEVWAYGLRNPWRFVIDDGQVLIGDVGQDAIEELDAVGIEEAEGANFGWPILEGPRCFRQEECTPPPHYVPPVASYTHEQTGGCSVIAGDVYRGEVPAPQGHWFYTDLCAGFLR